MHNPLTDQGTWLMRGSSVNKKKQMTDTHTPSKILHHLNQELPFPFSILTRSRHNVRAELEIIFTIVYEVAYWVFKQRRQHSVCVKKGVKSSTLKTFIDWL